jgi:phosphatidylglycerophosphate synthase
MKKNLANYVTGFRAVQIPFIFASILFVNIPLALLLYCAALLSDVLDGYLARKLGSASFEGALFDVCVDFLLVFSGIFACTIMGIFEPWMLGLVTLTFLQFL